MKKFLLVLSLGLVFSIGLVFINQHKVNAETVSPTGNCALAFQTDLTIGSTGYDVWKLQVFLVSRGYLVIPQGANYGYFGLLTQAAVAGLQTSVGISPADGYFGAVTRAYVNNIICGGSTAPSITVTSPNGGEKWTTASQMPIEWTINPLPPNQFAIKLMNENGTGFVADLMTCGIANVFQDGNRFWFNWRVGFNSDFQEIPDGNYKVMVTNCGDVRDVSDSSFSVFTAPSTPFVHLNSLSNFAVTNGDQLTIYGSGFTLSGNTVHFGDINPTHQYVSNGTSLTLAVSKLPYGSYPITVSNINGTSNSINILVTDNSNGGPTIYNLIPSSSIVGGLSEIDGSGKFNSVIFYPSPSDAGCSPAQVAISFSPITGRPGFIVPNFYPCQGPSHLVHPGDYVVRALDSNNWQISNAVNFSVVKNDPSPFHITFPDSGTILQTGQTYNIAWTGGDPGVDSYSLYLIGGALGKNGSLFLGQGYASKHSFSWTVPIDIKPASDYKISFSGAHATGGESPAFTISSPVTNPAYITSVNPTQGTWGTGLVIHGQNLIPPLGNPTLQFKRNGQVLGSTEQIWPTSKDGTELQALLDSRLVANMDEGMYDMNVRDQRGETNYLNFQIYHCPTPVTCKPPVDSSTKLPTTGTTKSLQSASILQAISNLINSNNDYMTAGVQSVLVNLFNQLRSLK